MKYWRYVTALVLIALASVALAVAGWPSEDLAHQRAFDGAPEECDSCTLRHQRVGKGAESRAREGATLKELYEESISDERTQQ